MQITSQARRLHAQSTARFARLQSSVPNARNPLPETSLHSLSKKVFLLIIILMLWSCGRAQITAAATCRKNKTSFLVGGMLGRSHRQKMRAAGRSLFRPESEIDPQVQHVLASWRHSVLGSRSQQVSTLQLMTAFTFVPF